MPRIDLIDTGVPGLDEVLGGGLPELSFNIIAGAPGSGKTTLAHQILFHAATPEAPAVYFTLVGEPPVKMLRYQQQFEFFDQAEVGSSVHFVNLTDEALAGQPEVLLERILADVERLRPSLVVVDSFHSLQRFADAGAGFGALSFQRLIQRLATHMTRWAATTFLLGEFERDRPTTPVFTVADGVIWLRSYAEGDSDVRRLEVEKVRGLPQIPGPHAYRITDEGVRVYPRLLREFPEKLVEDADELRLSTGIPGLDEMMGGGIVGGDAVVVSGPSGSGKSVLGMQFAGAGLAAGESVVVATFEETLTRYCARGLHLGIDFPAAQREGRAVLMRRAPLDLSMSESFEDIWDAAMKIGASRVVIDSLSGLRVAAKGVDTERVMRIREAVARVVHTLTNGGITVLMTTELVQQADHLQLTPHETSFLADDVILQRYVEVRGELRSVMSVIKMRRSAHSHSFREYRITAEGIEMGDLLSSLHGILHGVPNLEQSEDSALGGGGSTT